MNNENLKITEMEKRIRRLEKQVKIPVFNYYLSVKSCEILQNKQTFKFIFDCLSTSYLKFLSYVKSTGSNIDAKYYINGTFAGGKKYENGNFLFDGIFPLPEGRTEVVVELESVNRFVVNNISFETFGNIAYTEDECILSGINESSLSYVLFISDNTLNVKKYENNEIFDVCVKNNVKGGALCKIGSDFLLSYIGENGVLYCEKYGADFNFIRKIVLSEHSGYVSAISGNEGIIFSVNGNVVEKYTVRSDMSFLKENTSYRGKKVITNPSVNSCIILVDYSGNGKLVSL